MRRILLAILFVFGVALLAPATASAAPIDGAAIGALADSENMIEQVQCRRVCGPYGCRTRCYGRRPLYVAPFAPVIRGPVCRSVRVCDWRGCYWRRRCW